MQTPKGDAKRVSRSAAAGEPPVADNVRAMSHLEHRGLSDRTAFERLADAVASGAGSTWSVVLHAAFFAAWLLVNWGGFGGLAVFDAPPFGLLTIIVSLEVIFLSLFILISQNRMSRHAERREHLHLQINLLAEQESTATLTLLRRLCEHHGIALDEGTRGLEERTNIHDLVEKIDREVPGRGRRD